MEFGGTRGGAALRRSQAKILSRLIQFNHLTTPRRETPGDARARTANVLNKIERFENPCNRPNIRGHAFIQGSQRTNSVGTLGLALVQINIELQIEFVCLCQRTFCFVLII